MLPVGVVEPLSCPPGGTTPAASTPWASGRAPAAALRAAAVRRPGRCRRPARAPPSASAVSRAAERLAGDAERPAGPPGDVGLGHRPERAEVVLHQPRPGLLPVHRRDPVRPPRVGRLPGVLAGRPGAERPAPDQPALGAHQRQHLGGDGPADVVLLVGGGQDRGPQPRARRLRCAPGGGPSAATWRLHRTLSSSSQPDSPRGRRAAPGRWAAVASCLSSVLRMRRGHVERRGVVDDRGEVERHHEQRPAHRHHPDEAASSYSSAATSAGVSAGHRARAER